MRRPSILRVVCVLATMLTAGCGSNRGVTDSGTPDGSLLPDGPVTASSWRFVPDDTGSATPAVVLLPSSKTGAPAGEVWVDVVLRGVPGLQGLAFRLTYDPKRIKAASGEEGDAWQLSAVTHVARFAARPEGELWAGLGHVGSHSLAATSPVTVARVKLTPTGSSAIPIQFRALHNVVLDSKGAAVKVEWLGGKLEPVK